ncbi:unnamed protein product [Amoebophrya sp. A120]|nr:unnamed protein product [Amoebophrya sp. A120]|eukprot:GSA120T00000873001.1
MRPPRFVRSTFFKERTRKVLEVKVAARESSCSLARIDEGVAAREERSLCGFHKNKNLMIVSNKAVYIVSNSICFELRFAKYDLKNSKNEVNPFQSCYHFL